MTVDTRWVSGSGYRPVTVAITPTMPVTADRTLTVEFVVQRYWGPGTAADRVVTDIAIPAGYPLASGPVRETIAIPRTAGWNSYQVNVLEDSKLLKPLCLSGAGDNYPVWDEICPKILVVSNPTALLVGGTGEPDTTALAQYLRAADYDQYDPLPPTPTGKVLLPTAIARDIGELPRRWIDYTNLDMVCLSLPQLNELATGHRDVFRALLEWTAAGGNLCVYGVGTDRLRLAELEQLVGLPPHREGSGNEPLGLGWHEPDENLFNKPPTRAGFPAVDVYGQYNPSGAGQTQTEEDSQKSTSPPKPPAQAPFVFRQFAAGMLVAIARDDPFPGTEHEWGWLLATLGSKRLLWYQRHGVSTLRENADFWNFLIPGVGLVPVTGFQVLITLFVVAIGPVNYFLLRRWSKLHLLVVTTPVSALAVTLVLFGYAVVADGLGTRVRVRSATCIDQRRGQAVCWSRLSYYAGLAPARGLTFPADVAVVPLEFVPGDSPSGRRELVWSGQQRLTAGWLTSRTPTQFVTVRSRASMIGLDIEAREDATDGLEIGNRLQTRIEQLLVRSKQGNYYWGSGIDQGASRRLVPIDPAPAFDRMRQTHRKTEPSFPPGANRPGQNSFVSRGVFRMRWDWMYNQANASPPTQSTGRLEDVLASLRPATGTGAAALEPGSYLAIVESSPEVVVGVRSARQEAGFHFVQGTW